ncbi:MAG: (2Fe-2S) ferredoxin domain-containing protein [Candidatus Cloacimonetes bacterium]|nr:(2Fe-2S) ferredoxin domain-containing protein [Candidatus Cloacimonadota bacterium]MBL7149364.1 (2Fe-2S) ferredoxin domain-containing protein [Candidatus Cloacimonadota bacterium]
MSKLKPEDLAIITERIKRTMILREGTGRAIIRVHMGTCGIAAGARTIMNTLMNEIESRNIKDIILTTSSCAGLCSREPMITVEVQNQPPVKYVDLTPEKTKIIFDKHILSGEIVKEYALAFGSERVP